MGFIHLLHVFFGMLIAYFAVAIIGAILGIAIVLWVIYKATQHVVGSAMWVILACLLLCSAPRTVYASSVHVSHKAYHKEVIRIMTQYSQEVRSFRDNPPAGVSDLNVSAYIMLYNLDTLLVLNDLYRYDHHMVSQGVVDKDLNQLSRDIENTPPSMASSTDLKN